MAGEDDAAQEIAAMQFAAGKSIAQLVTEWERDVGWVEEAVRSALLAAIPVRDGGTKETREQARAGRRDERQAAQAEAARQTTFGW